MLEEREPAERPDAIRAARASSWSSSDAETSESSNHSAAAIVRATP